MTDPGARIAAVYDASAAAYERYWAPALLRRATATVPRAQADALALPVRPGCVDVAVAAFVLFLLPDAHRAARELHRVLVPGGELLAATWGEQRSDGATNSPEAMHELLHGAGFEDVRTVSRPLDARFTPVTMLEMRTSCGVTGRRFAQLDARAQGEVRARLREHYAGLGEEAFTDSSEVLLSSARRPR